MTQQEIRVAIAEKCGFEILRHTENKPGYEVCGRLKYKDWQVIPDYCNDLNAMHEAEKVLNSCNTREDNGVSDLSYYRYLIDIQSTASERAEAFCRVFWPEKFKG